MYRTLLSLAAAALLAGCGASHSGAGTPRPDANAGRARLIALLGVLRRPASAADTTPALAAELAQRARFPGCVAQVADPGLTRRIGIAPGGAGVYLVAFRPARCVVQCTGTGRSCARPQPEVEWAALFVETSRFAQQVGMWTASDVAAGRAVGFAPSPAGGGTLTIAVMPDRVAHVTMTVGPLDHPPTHTVTVPVHANVAVLGTGPGTNVELKRSP